VVLVRRGGCSLVMLWFGISGLLGCSLFVLVVFWGWSYLFSWVVQWKGFGMDLVPGLFIYICVCVYVYVYVCVYVPAYVYEICLAQFWT